MLSRLAPPSQTVDGALEDGLDLLPGDAGEPGEEVFDRGPALQVLEEGEDGYAGAAEDPFSESGSRGMAGAIYETTSC